MCWILREILEIIKEKKAVFLYNKSDLNPVLKIEEIKKIANAPVIKISAKHGHGIEEFEDLIKEMFLKEKIGGNDEVFITSARQKNDIFNACQSIIMVEQSISEGVSEDFYTIDFMNAYESLGRVIGEAVEEDLVNTIFSRFCMGK